MGHDETNARSASLVREIAHLRAKRAARLSSAAAAGNRRMLLSLLLACATVVLAVAVPLTLVTWPWIFAGVAPLAGVLGWSRAAAIREARADAAEIEELRELRERVRAAGVARTRTVEVTKVRDVDAVPSSEVDEGDVSVEAVTDELAVAAPAEEDQEEVVVETARVERMTWSVTPIPAPTYAMRGRVTGRSIHPDTDIRGIPKVEARIPLRPVKAQAPAADALSTEDVVASEVVALDLDAVLEARRAQ